MRILAITMAMSPSLWADTLYVGEPKTWLLRQDTFEEGPSFSTAAEAVAAARDGDRVLVLKEITKPLTIDKQIELLGYGAKARPIVQAPVTVTASGVVIDNLHFRTLTSTAIEIAGANDVVVKRCFFTDCQNSITASGSSNLRIIENRMLFSGSTRLSGGGDSLLRGNQIDSGGIYAVHFESSSNNRFIGNHIRRAGWVGLILYSNSAGTLLEENIFEGSDIGLSIQTNGNVVRNNLFFNLRHGLALTRSPLGKDASVYDKIAYEDSDTGDTRVVIRENKIESNTFRNCRRESVVLKQAQENRLTGNAILGEAARGIVLLDEANQNLIDDTTFGPDIAESVRIVRSTGNVIEGPQNSGTVSLLQAPGNTVKGFLTAELALAPPKELPQALGSDKRLAFGDFHTHSLLSDGASTPDELLGYARDVADLDFVALSDHGEYVGHGDERWNELNETVQRYTNPGRFIAIPGYETTFMIGWSGHYNVYFAGPEGKPYMAPHGGRTWIPNLATPTPTHLLEQLAEGQEDALVIRHHYFATPEFWNESPADSDVLPMTEVCSTHAIWSGHRDVDAYASSRGSESRGHVSTLMGALQTGRVLGVGGSSDSHYTFPGDSGLTGVMTDGLDTESLFEAIRARRTYATTGARIRLGFTVNGQPMGSVLTGNETPSGLALVEGTADLEEVAIYQNGRVLVRVEPEGRTASVPFTADAPPPDGTWYMVRVIQADGEMAWSTPIWIRPQAPNTASTELLADRERMVLLAYSSVLRNWPQIPSRDLNGLTPREAQESEDPAIKALFEEAWTRYQQTVSDLEERALEIGLDNKRAAKAIIQRFASHFQNLEVLPRVTPMVNLEEVRQELGM
ncbi:MAG: CehA/McbA family metallohydrolase [Planctomycetota bacterium]|nr:CehA/McbA family metallohydrolase [Planctomycetota bacterium]